MAEIGDLVTLGAYPQSSSDPSQKEPIQWLVLAKEEGKLLCISQLLLDCKPYHHTPEMVTWASCDLRRWLNRNFLESAFSFEEQGRILTTHLINHKGCPQYDTDDKLFLLDYEAAVDYFESEDHLMTRSALTTLYARSRGAWFLSPQETEAEDPLLYAGCWWLRLPEVTPTNNPDGLYDVLSCVNYDDYIELYASSVEETNVCVRPAFWMREG